MNHTATGIILIILLTFIIPGTTLAQEANEEEIKSGYPYASLSEEEIDMGVMKAGSNGDGTITLTNLGEPDLLIARIRSSCGLMIPTWPETAISRGDTVSVRFRYNTSRLGSFERKITIHTNGWQKNLIVTVKGEVIPEEQL